MRVLYFARIREALGIGEESVELPAAASDVAALVTALRARGGAYAEQLARPHRVAVNREMVGSDAPVRDGDEVAVFPPVTGG